MCSPLREQIRCVKPVRSLTAKQVYVHTDPDFPGYPRSHVFYGATFNVHVLSQKRGQGHRNVSNTHRLSAA